MGKLLRDGAIAGLLAGAVLALVLLAVGEETIGRAIELEAGAPGQEHDEMFTRSTQAAGGVAGSLIYGTALGMVFAVVFTSVRHRLHVATDVRRAGLVAAAGWTGAVLVPFLLYPPNPPGVGTSGSVEQRTVAYLLAVLWGLVAVFATARLARQLHLGGRNDGVVAAGAVLLFVGLVALAAVVFPEAPSAAGVPADLVWSFRLRSLAGTSACWLALGLTFGALVSRTNARELAHA